MPDIGGDNYYHVTPEREERLQLLAHQLDNGNDIPYLRAPAGAGKTRFAHRLAEHLADDFLPVRVQAGEEPPEDVIAEALGIAPGAAWPDAALEKAGDGRLLVMVDDADRLGSEDLEALALLHQHGAATLLIGRGGLARNEPDWDVRFVDLPMFTEAQSIALFEALGHIENGVVSAGMAKALHRSSNGSPGLMLLALTSLPKAGVGQVTAPRHGMSPWLVASIAGVLVVIVAVLAFQDSINALFQPAAPQVAAEATPTPGAAETRAVVQDEQPAPTVADGVIERRPAAQEPPVALPPPSAPASSPEATQAPTTVAATDVLEAVMQDAIEAAGERAGDAVVPPGAVSTPGDAEADLHPRDTELPEILAGIGAFTRAAGSDAPPPPADPQTAPPLAGTGTAEQPPQGAALPPVEAVVAAAPEAPVPVSRPKPEPESRPAPQPKLTPKPPEARPSAPAAPPAQAAASDGMAWLREQKPPHYTLQLMGARDRDRIVRFVRRHRLTGPMAIFERELKGLPWYSLVYGSYPSRDAAVAARDRLPGRLKGSDAWPRTFDSIVKSLK